MKNDALKFVSALYDLERQGSVGVGMDDLLPVTVRKLEREGYCQVTETRNPHQLSNVSQYFVALTATARRLVQAHN